MKTARTRAISVLVRAVLICAICFFPPGVILAQEDDPILPFLTQDAGTISLRYPEGIIAIAFHDIYASGTSPTDEQRATHLATTRLANFFVKDQVTQSTALSGSYPIWTKRFSIGDVTYLRVVVACCELLLIHQPAIIAMLDARWPDAERNLGYRIARAGSQGGARRSLPPSLIAPLLVVPSKDELLTLSNPSGVDR